MDSNVVAPPAANVGDATIATAETNNAAGGNHPLPGALPSDFPGPLAVLTVDEMNIRENAVRQGRRDRLEAESRGFDGIFGAVGATI